MFIAKQGNLIVQAALTLEELKSKLVCVDVDSIEEISEELELVDGKFVNASEKARIEHKRIQNLSMTPLDFIKALETYAGISYTQVKELCDTYPEIDRELRFCQNVYRNNSMFSQESLSKLPEAFRLTDEQIDRLFVEVDKIKQEQLQKMTEESLKDFEGTV